MANSPRAGSRDRTVDANGVQIVVTEFPNPGRPPVLLLHGIGSQGNSWWPVIDPLAEQFHLYQLDLRGHGASGKPEHGYRVEQYAADLDAVLDALDLAEPRIMGHSLGALVTLFWASHRSPRAAAFVLEDPPLVTPPEILRAFDGWQQLAALTPAGAAAWYRQQYPDWSEEDCLRRAETITSTAPGVFSEMRATAEAALVAGTIDRIHLLDGVQTPTLLLRGNAELGGVVTPSDAAHLMEVMPHARDVYFPEVGHGIHRDATEAFLAAVIPFLERPEA